VTEDEADPARDDELFAELIGRLHVEGKLPDDPRELAARLRVKPPPLVQLRAAAAKSGGKISHMGTPSSTCQRSPSRGGGCS
jgi:hypothetical protein